MDNYHVLDQLAIGRRAAVFKARRRRTLRYLAMKRYDIALQAHVQHTITHLHALKHVNVLGFEEWFATARHLYVAVEYCAGGSFAGILGADKSFPCEAVRLFAADMVSALLHVHQNGFILGDVRPSTFLSDENGTLKCADFCCALTCVAADLPSRSRSLPTSVGYTSPELLLCGGELAAPEDACALLGFEEAGKLCVASRASDLFALGCLLYHIAVGAPPFAGASAEECLRMMLDASKVSGSSDLHSRWRALEPKRDADAGVKPLVPPCPALCHILLRMLELDPLKRAGWAEILAHPFWRGPTIPVAPAEVSNFGLPRYFDSRSTLVCIPPVPAALNLETSSRSALDWAAADDCLRLPLEPHWVAYCSARHLVRASREGIDHFLGAEIGLPLVSGARGPAASFPETRAEPAVQTSSVARGGPEVLGVDLPLAAARASVIAGSRYLGAASSLGHRVNELAPNGGFSKEGVAEGSRSTCHDGVAVKTDHDELCSFISTVASDSSADANALRAQIVAGDAAAASCGEPESRSQSPSASALFTVPECDGLATDSLAQSGAGSVDATGISEQHLGTGQFVSSFSPARFDEQIQQAVESKADAPEGATEGGSDGDRTLDADVSVLPAIKLLPWRVLSGSKPRVSNSLATPRGIPSPFLNGRGVSIAAKKSLYLVAVLPGDIGVEPVVDESWAATGSASCTDFLPFRSCLDTDRGIAHFLSDRAAVHQHVATVYSSLVRSNHTVQLAVLAYIVRAAGASESLCNWMVNSTIVAVLVRLMRRSRSPMVQARSACAIGCLLRRATFVSHAVVYKHGLLEALASCIRSSVPAPEECAAPQVSGSTDTCNYRRHSVGAINVTAASDSKGIDDTAPATGGSTSILGSSVTASGREHPATMRHAAAALAELLFYIATRRADEAQSDVTVGAASSVPAVSCTWGFPSWLPDFVKTFCVPATASQSQCLGDDDSKWHVAVALLRGILNVFSLAPRIVRDMFDLDASPQARISAQQLSLTLLNSALAQVHHASQGRLLCLQGFLVLQSFFDGEGLDGSEVVPGVGTCAQLVAAEARILNGLAIGFHAPSGGQTQSHVTESLGPNHFPGILSPEVSGSLFSRDSDELQGPNLLYRRLLLAHSVTLGALCQVLGRSLDGYLFEPGVDVERSKLHAGVAMLITVSCRILSQSSEACAPFTSVPDGDLGACYTQAQSIASIAVKTLAFFTLFVSLALRQESVLVNCAAFSISEINGFDLGSGAIQLLSCCDSIAACLMQRASILGLGPEGELMRQQLATTSENARAAVRLLLPFSLYKALDLPLSEDAPRLCVQASKDSAVSFAERAVFSYNSAVFSVNTTAHLQLDSFLDATELQEHLSWLRFLRCCDSFFTQTQINLLVVSWASITGVRRQLDCCQRGVALWDDDDASVAITPSDCSTQRCVLFTAVMATVSEAIEREMRISAASPLQSQAVAVERSMRLRTLLCLQAALLSAPLQVAAILSAVVPPVIDSHQSTTTSPSYAEEDTMHSQRELLRSLCNKSITVCCNLLINCDQARGGSELPTLRFTALQLLERLASLRCRLGEILAFMLPGTESALLSGALHAASSMVIDDISRCTEYYRHNAAAFPGDYPLDLGHTRLFCNLLGSLVSAGNGSLGWSKLVHIFDVHSFVSSSIGSLLALGNAFPEKEARPPLREWVLLAGDLLCEALASSAAFLKHGDTSLFSAGAGLHDSESTICPAIRQSQEAAAEPRDAIHSSEASLAVQMIAEQLTPLLPAMLVIAISWRVGCADAACATAAADICLLLARAAPLQVAFTLLGWTPTSLQHAVNAVSLFPLLRDESDRASETSAILSLPGDHTSATLRVVWPSPLTLLACNKSERRDLESSLAATHPSSLLAHSEKPAGSERIQHHAQDHHRDGAIAKRLAKVVSTAAVASDDFAAAARLLGLSRRRHGEDYRNLGHGDPVT